MESNLDINSLSTEQYTEFKKHIITNMHFQLCNNLVKIAKLHGDELPKDIPEVVKILEHIRLFEEEFGEYINKI